MIAAEESMSVVAVTLALAASVALIVLNGFYVAYEFAVLAARRSAFEDESVRDRPSSVAARAALSDVSMQLAGAQLGITIASLALGRISEPALEVLIEALLGESVSPELARGIGIVVSLGVFTFLHLIFGEMVPKNIALVAPDATLRWLVIPYRLYLFVFRPVVRMLNELANLGTRAVGIEPRDELQVVHTASELAAIVTHSTEGGAIDIDDAALLQGALGFAQRPVRDLTTPLAESVTVPLGATAVQLEEVVASTGQDRILVVHSNDGPSPIGYLHARDLLGVDPTRRTEPVPTHFVRNMAVVEADRSLVEVLRRLRRSGRQLAVVEGPQGPIGVVSLEEVVQALIQPLE